MTELPLANQIHFFISYATAFLVFALIDARACPLYPAKADICSAQAHVRFGPKADIWSDMISIESHNECWEGTHANFAWKAWQGPEWPKSKGP